MSKFLLSFTILLFNVALVYGQTGTIKGKIIDAATQEEVIGANVVIEGTQIGGSTDINGDFNIFNISPGTYNISITYIGYKPKVVQGVTVYAGKITTMNTTLEEDAGQLEDIVVEATRETFTEIALISEIRLAESVAVGISAEQISKSLDRDASQVVRRIPGINVSEGSFIRVRGLSERYNNVMLHNAFAPSAETDIKSFAFNLIPSSQIDRLLIFKSPAADLPGDFSGGLVKVFTKSIPSENSLTLDYGIQFRAGTTFQDFRNQERSNSHWTGLNSGLYDLPSGFPAAINVPSISDNPQRLQEVGRSLSNLWGVEDRTAPLDQRFGITSASRFNLGNVKVGNITALTYSNSFATYNIFRADYNDPVAGAGRLPVYEYDDAQYNQSIRIGLLHNWAFKLNQNHIIEFKNLFNQTGNSQYIDREGPVFESFVFVNSAGYDQIYRSLYTGQLTGKHTLWNESTTIEWVAGYNQSKRNQPDFKRYRSDVVGENQVSLFVPIGNAQPFFLGRFYADMNESSYTGAVNIVQKLNFLNKGSKELTPELRAGVFYENKERSFNARNIGYVQASSGGNFDLSLLDLSIVELFNPVNINPTTGIRIDELTNAQDSYGATNRLFAGYIMGKYYFGEKFTVVGGVRLEDNIQKVISVNNSLLDKVSILPSVNMTYNINDKMLIRGAYGTTLNRPEFRELADFSFFDFTTNFVYGGNPRLQNANIENFDLRWEYYPSPSELVSLALFYKDFTNPIEVSGTQGAGSGGAKNFTFLNVQSAYNYGVELEVRKSLSFLSKGSRFFESMSTVLNASLLKSEITLSEEAISFGNIGNRPLQGQANYIVNAALFYNDEQSGWQVNLLYNVVGKYIQFVGIQQYPDIYNMPRNLIDISVNKSIGEKWVIKAGIADILNQNVLWLQDANRDGVFERTGNTDQIIQKYKPGQLFSLGVTYRVF